MKLGKTPRTYLQAARELSSFWDRPLLPTVTKMLASRVLYGRGPKEFNQYRFAIKKLGQWTDYLDDDERVRTQESAAPPELRELEENKILFWQRCMRAGLPTIPITVLIQGEHPLPDTPGIEIARSPDEFRAIVEPLGDFEGFAKPLDGGQGYGAFSFDVRDGTVYTDEFQGPLVELAHRCVKSRFGKTGYIIQPRMRAHSELSDIMTGPGLGTVRLTTFIDRQGRLEIPWAILKIPGPGQVVCNPRLGALMLAVDVETGRLSAAVGPLPGSGVVRDVTHHPVTGKKFDGFQLPLWDDVVAAVTKAAKAFQELPCLGWDVAIAEEGPVLIETNWEFGMHTQQIAMDRGLKEQFRALYKRCDRSVTR